MSAAHSRSLIKPPAPPGSASKVTKKKAKNENQKPTAKSTKTTRRLSKLSEALTRSHTAFPSTLLALRAELPVEQTETKKNNFSNLKHNGRVAKNGTRRFSNNIVGSRTRSDCVTLIINYQVVELPIAPSPLSLPPASRRERETPQRVARCSHSAFINLAKRQARPGLRLRHRLRLRPSQAKAQNENEPKNDHLHHLPTTY